MDNIKIKKLDVFAKHGVYKEENVLGQKFVFSAVLYLDTAKAGASDELEDSVNYGEVCHFIREFAEGRTFKLLDSLAEHTAAAVLDRFPLVKRIDLKSKSRGHLSGCLWSLCRWRSHEDGIKPS